MIVNRRDICAVNFPRTANNSSFWELKKADVLYTKDAHKSTKLNRFATYI